MISRKVKPLQFSGKKALVKMEFLINLIDLDSAGSSIHGDGLAVSPKTQYKKGVVR
jgi:hypothetical protein